MTEEPQKTKLLIVEDEASLRNALHDKFVREGFAVFTAKDGEVGLSVALQEKPDVILLDMMMPKMDGITMLHELRQKNEWAKRVPVLLLTNISSADKRMLKEIQIEGLADYLVKSDWSISKLVEKVKKTINSGNNSPT